MMRAEGRKVENCFASTHMYEYCLPKRISEAVVQEFAAFGVVTFHKNFPRPFFKVIFTDGTTVKGVLHDSIIKVQYPDNDPQTSKQQFEEILEEILQHNMQMR
jgi:hypothetical protein